tara:strand:+ start:906 stop:1037 length:132 start_codon:yes stop_codon:yes gene_type:complete
MPVNGNVVQGKKTTHCQKVKKGKAIHHLWETLSNLRKNRLNQK